MKPQLFETGETPTIEITSCAGDLVVRGWGDANVLVTGDGADVEETETGLTIVSNGDLVLTVPNMSEITAVSTSGDLVIQHMFGGIHLGEVNGDIVLKHTGNAKIGTISSDIAVRNIEGSLSIETISGDASISHVVGDVNIDSVSGDVSINHLNGAVSLHAVAGDASFRHVSNDVSVKAAQGDVSLRDVGGLTAVFSNGDIRLHGGLAAGEHSFTANGNITMRWPAGAGLDLHVISPEIKNRLTFDKLLESEGELTARIGEGEAIVRLEANDRVSLKEAELVDKKWGNFATFDFDFAGFGSEFGEQMSQRFTDFATEMETKFGPSFGDDIAEKVTRQAEKAVANMEKAMEKAMRRTEREASRQQRHEERRGARHAPRPPRTPAAPAAPARDTSAEQIKILKMVESGTISPQEASTLLEALG